MFLLYLQLLGRFNWHTLYFAANVRPLLAVHPTQCVRECLWVLWPRDTQGAGATVRKTSHTGSIGYSGQHSIALVPRLAPSRGLWLHHPREERKTERKTVCAHSSLSFSNYCPTNHQQGSIGSISDGGGATAAWQHRREGKSLKMPRDKRITDQYSRMDFVILKRAVRVVHSHLLEAPRARPSITPLLHPSLFFTATCLYLKR